MSCPAPSAFGRAYDRPPAIASVTQGLFRVLESPHDDAWLFVPVAAPAPEETVSGEETDGDDTAGAETTAEPTPGVPDVDGSGDPTPGVPDAGADSGTAPSAPDPDHSYEPVRVPRRGHGDLDGAVDALQPGYLVEAELSWAEQEPRVRSLAVRKRTLLAFADGVTNLFEAARSAWTEASATGQPMVSQVTRGTDGQVNGVLYVFADADGGDRLAEFQSGRRPLEPLLSRVNAAAPADDDSGASAWAPEDDEPSVSVGPGGVHVESGPDGPAPEHGLGRDREVFVLRPADGPFVVVLIALEKGGTLANTVRDTYHCPRPEE